MSMKTSNNTIGNRTRDLQPTAPPRPPQISNVFQINYFIIIWLICGWVSCWHVPVTHVLKSLKWSALVPSAFWSVLCTVLCNGVTRHSVYVLQTNSFPYSCILSKTAVISCASAIYAFLLGSIQVYPAIFLLHFNPVAVILLVSLAF